MVSLIISKNKERERIILRALQEDIGDGDVTTLAMIPPSQTLHGEFLAKSSGIISGLNVVEYIFKLLDKKIEFLKNVQDGSAINKGEIVARLSGSGIKVLMGERVALNFLQRMSGIATLTKQYVDAVKGTSAVILDTRKTVPTLRIFDKQAVRDGGGQNHRFGLFDMFLIKDNHIATTGSIATAMKMARTCNKNHLAIEIEVNTLSQLKEALFQKPDRIMLDNMNLSDMKKAVKIVAGLIPIEVSGGVSLETVSAIAQTGVQFISIGALTHSVRALDISLEIQKA